MSEQIVRPRRDVGIADHLWATFAEMSEDMGVDRESLVNQALFAFARANGYAVSTRPSQRASQPPVGREADAFAIVEAPPLEARDIVSAPPPTPPAPRLALAPILPSSPPQARPPAEELPASGDVEGRGFADGSDDEEGELLLRKAEELQRAALAESHPATPPSTPLSSLDVTPAPTVRSDDLPDLLLAMSGRQLDPVRSERFLIGRAKHCDLIINSGKVSREHAVIVREADGWYIEDNASSNGTWFDKERVTRRRIGDGDEFLICEEKLVCRLR